MVDMAAGVAHGTLFVHFPTRDDLIAAVIEESGQRIAARIHDLARAGTTVHEILVAHLEGLAEYEAFYARLVMEGPLLPPHAQATLLGIQSAISWLLAGVAEHEMAVGAIRPMPTHLLFNTWLGLVHHYVCNRELFAPGGSVLERWGPVLIDHYEALLRPGCKGGEQ